MIELSNGHTFDYMAASGALAYDGRGWPWEQPLRWSGLMDPSLFTVVTKTLTYEPRRGNLRWWNPFRCVRFLRDGVVNAVGLTNPGFRWWCDEIGPTVRRRKIPIVVSLLSESTAELAEMARAVSRFGIVGIELNASCPNTGSDMSNAWNVIHACHAIKATSDLPLILKLSVVHDHKTILEQVGDSIEAVAINSVPWRIAFSRAKPSPLEKFGGGGVSGKAVQRLTWNMARKLSGTVPVIGPSVWEYGDIEQLRALGASAVSFGSVFLRYPWRPTLFARRDSAERKRLCPTSTR